MTDTQKNQRAVDAEILRTVWREMIPEFCPSISQFRLWRDLHHWDIVLIGIREVIKKRDYLHGKMSPDRMIRFASSVMNDKEVKNLNEEGSFKNEDPIQTRSI